MSQRFFGVVVLALLVRSLAAPATLLAQIEKQLPPAGHASVAVLPFSNVTGDPTDAWIGAGIAETLIADLQRANEFTIIDPEVVTGARHAKGLTARTSDGEVALLSVARRVGARWMITGGYQRLGDQIRITGRLVEVQTGLVARAAKVDGALGELFGLQDVQRQLLWPLGDNYFGRFRCDLDRCREYGDGLTSLWTARAPSTGS